MKLRSDSSAALLSIVLTHAQQRDLGALASALSNLRLEVLTITSFAEVLETLASRQINALLLGASSWNEEVEAFLLDVKTQAPFVDVIVYDMQHDLTTILARISDGVADVIPAPSSPEELDLAVRKIHRRHSHTALPDAVPSKKNPLSAIISKSPQMAEIFDTVGRLSKFSTTVLVTGESGTGKELLARAIHESSPRQGRPFLAINCGAIPETLMESELFGHRKGAFTDATRDKKGLFEEADNGTIFLDEIGELPLHLQVKLLRVLQEQQIRRVGDEQVINIDVRVIAATLRDLEQDVAAGRFRDDLFYRLNVVSIHLPALRDRPEDIPILAQHFLNKHSKRLRLKSRRMPDAVLKCLMRQFWKGNARELENCMERALVLSKGDEIELEALPDYIRQDQSDEGQSLFSGLSEDNLSIKQRTRELEINLIHRALKKTRGNRTHAAKVLEISHRALLYKLKEYNIGGDKDRS